MAKEAYVHGKRPMYMAKEAYVHGKRGPPPCLLVCFAYGKRGLCTWQERPVYMAKEVRLPVLLVCFAMRLCARVTIYAQQV